LKQDLRGLDERIIMAKGELNRLILENGRLDAEIKNYGDKVPLPLLENNFKCLFNEVESLKENLNKYKSAKIEFVSKEQKAKIQKEYEKYAKEWRKYKRISNEMIATIVENCGIKKNDLIVNQFFNFFKYL
jgi:hypothetical protein